jgi:hypothetical protein
VAQWPKAAKRLLNKHKKILPNLVTVRESTDTNGPIVGHFSKSHPVL